MLNNNQKRQLKGLGATLKNKYQVGKNGKSDTLVDMLDKALTAHELIKIEVLKSYEGSIDELANDLSTSLKAETVQVIGRTILLFRINKENNKIKLVR